MVARFKLKLCVLRAQGACSSHPEPVSVTRQADCTAKGSRTLAKRGWHRNCPSMRPHPMGEFRLQDLKGHTMHIKGVLHALAVAARVAILLPTVGLAWLIWNR